MGAILEFTDGTALNTIDLLGRYNGYLLCDWRPSRPEFEHILNRNFLTGTETPAMVIQKPAIDTFTFSARNGSADDLIDDEQKMSRILYLASLYWTRSRGVPNPYYIKAKNRNESGIRYAAMFTTQLHDSGNPYATPFFNNIATDTDLVVPVTHGSWLDYPPGTGGFNMEANLMSMIQSEITDRYRGIVGSEDGSRILLANMLSHVVLDSIYRGDGVDVMSSGSFVYDLFTTDVSQYTTFAIRYYDNKFILKENGLVGIQFNITKPANAVSGFKWQVLVESFGLTSWEPLDVIDGTNNFTKSGSVLFDMSKYGDTLGVNWENTFSMYKVRVRPSSDHLAARPSLTFVSPEISGSHPASINLPYFDILFAGNQYISPTTQVIKPVHNTRNLPFDSRFVTPDMDVDYFLMHKAKQVGNPSIAGTFNLEFDATESKNKPANIMWQVRSTGINWERYYGDVANVVVREGDYSTVLKDETGVPSVLINGTWEGGHLVHPSPFKTVPDFSSAISPAHPDVNNVSQGFANVTEFTFDSSRSHLDIDNESVDYIEWTFGDEIVVPPPPERDLEILRIDAGARFEMWDEASSSYKEISFGSRGLGDTLEFFNSTQYTNFKNYGWIETLVDSFDGKVKIVDVLRISKGASFEMWDDEAGLYKRLSIGSHGGNPSLVVSDAISSNRGKLEYISRSVEVSGTLRIEKDTIFEMWNPTLGKFRRLELANIGGVTRLVFSDPSTWDGSLVGFAGKVASGKITVGNIVKHIYKERGSYTVRMIIHMNSGRKAETVKYDSIHIHSEDGAIAYFVAHKPRGFAPHNPEFDASKSVIDSAASIEFKWDFGDGTTGTGMFPAKIYTKHGIYSVTLTTTETTSGGSKRTSTYTREKYIYIDSEQLYAGDNGMYLELGFRQLNPSTAMKNNITKMYIGSRSLIESDDSFFQGYLPFYKDSWYPSATKPYPLVLFPFVFRIEEHSESYTGYAYTGTVDRSSDGHGVEKELLSLRIPKDIAHIYRGTYRLFLRLKVDARAEGDRFYFWADVSQYVGSGDALGGKNKTRKVTDLVSSHLITTLDLGSISLGGRDGMTQDINIYWQGFFSGPYEQHLSVFDVILIPQDEWFAEITFPAHRGIGDLVTIGSITPDGGLETSVAGSNIEYVPSSTPNTPLSLLGNDVRFTTLSTVHDYARSIDPNLGKIYPVQYSDFNLVTEVSKALKVSKFFGSRGKR